MEQSEFELLIKYIDWWIEINAMQLPPMVLKIENISLSIQNLCFHDWKILYEWNPEAFKIC